MTRQVPVGGGRLVEVAPLAFVKRWRRDL